MARPYGPARRLAEMLWPRQACCRDIGATPLPHSIRERPQHLARCTSRAALVVDPDRAIDALHNAVERAAHRSLRAPRARSRPSPGSTRKHPSPAPIFPTSGRPSTNTFIAPFTSRSGSAAIPVLSKSALSKPRQSILPRRSGQAERSRERSRHDRRHLQERHSAGHRTRDERPSGSCTAPKRTRADLVDVLNGRTPRPDLTLRSIRRPAHRNTFYENRRSTNCCPNPTLLGRLKKTRLRGFDRAEVYRDGNPGSRQRRHQQSNACAALRPRRRRADNSRYRRRVRAHRHRRVRAARSAAVRGPKATTSPKPRFHCCRL